MKNTAIIIITGLASMTAFDALPNDGVAVPIRQDKPSTPNPPLRPHGEESSVTGFYRDGVLSLSFDSYEGMATATLTNLFTGERDSWTFSTATQPSLHTIGSVPATYTLTIKTAENTYEAIFAID